ncbi:helix-turn-helix transcriptional regulator [uncultured Phyllobacterium sp.]|uniref:helix-turn-helix domain-containing protein n=1 Tax=uncultured Phyllobacterium sp. TaxID=253813 RepID=UPI00339059C2
MIDLQCKMARAALGLGVRDLAALARVSTDTIARLERGEKLKPATIMAIAAALETAGLSLRRMVNGGPGVRLRMKE